MRLNLLLLLVVVVVFCVGVYDWISQSSSLVAFFLLFLALIFTAYSNQLKMRIVL